MSHLSFSSSTHSYNIPSRENSDSSLAKRHAGSTGATRKPFNDMMVNSKSRLKTGLKKPKTSPKVYELLKPSAPYEKDVLPRPCYPLELPRPTYPLEMDELPRPTYPLEMNELPRPTYPLEMDELPRPTYPLEMDELPRPTHPLEMNELPRPTYPLEMNELPKPTYPLEMDELPRPTYPLEMDELPRPTHPLEMNELPRPNTPIELYDQQRPGTSLEVGELLPCTGPIETPMSNLKMKLEMIDRDMKLDDFLYICEEEPVYDVVWDYSTLLGAEDLVTMLDNFYKYRSSTPNQLDQVPSRPQTPETGIFDLPCFEESLALPNVNDISLDDLDLYDNEDKESSI